MGSFRQLLLVAFMLIAALLSATALRAVVILERLVAQSGQEAARALELSGAAQSLAARTAGMERAARQSLVLNDAPLRRRFEEEGRAARNTLQQIAVAGLATADLATWRAQADGIAHLLDGPVETALDRERLVATEFRELDGINNRIVARVQAQIEGRNKALRDQLEAE